MRGIVQSTFELPCGFSSTSLAPPPPPSAKATSPPPGSNERAPLCASGSLTDVHVVETPARLVGATSPRSAEIRAWMLYGLTNDIVAVATSASPRVPESDEDGTIRAPADATTDPATQDASEERLPDVPKPSRTDMRATVATSAPSTVPMPRDGDIPAKPRGFGTDSKWCPHCEQWYNSNTQFMEHESGRKHIKACADGTVKFQ